jgi:hypothetical protein
MRVHSVQAHTIEGQIDALKSQHAQQKSLEPFQDPIREFSRGSRVEGLVRGWLTYPIDERKRLIRANFLPLERRQAVPSQGIREETDKEFESRQLERWRVLCIIIQEESRAKAGNRSPEVAIAALKLLFPEHDWKVPATVTSKG